MSLIVDMESTGIAVDVGLLTELEAEFAGEVRAAQEDAHDIVGREFNLGSPKQLQEVLFDELGLPKTKRIKTGYTTDAEALNGLYASTAHPVLEALLRFRDASRLRQTVAGLIPLADSEQPGPHHVQPDGGRDRPAVEHRPEPAEHPGAHRRRPADPGGVRRRARLRVADDRGLLADRDADHGPPVRR